MTSKPLRAAALAALAVLGSCKGSGGTSLLVFGGPAAPHEHLVERVRASAKELAAARDEFVTAFRLYERLTAPQAVDLEDLRADFGAALRSCKKRGESFGKRVDAVRAEKERLLQGWSAELGQFSGEALRKKSETQMQDCEARAQRVLAALERVQERMRPVLLKLSDYDLFFHHNLNARAIATLEDTYKDFDAEYRSLAREFERTRSETDEFLAHFVPAAPGADPRAD